MENNKKEKSPIAKQVGISISFLGLLYLSYEKARFAHSGAPFLSTFLRFLPSEITICWYWIVFFLYFTVWYQNDSNAKSVRAAFWSFWIAIVVSNVVMLGVGGVQGKNILPYLLNEIPRSGVAVLAGWITYGVLQLFVYMFIGGIVGLFDYDRGPDEIHKRGKKLISLSKAREIAATKKEEGSPGVEFGWIRVPDSQATTHFAVVGTTGSGKTLLIRTLMDSVFPHIGKGRDARALVYDAKRDMLPILASLGLKAEIITLHPFDKRGAAWDMAKDVTSPASADQTATILIPHEKGNTSPFFTDAARALMTGVMTVFIRKCPDRWTFRDVIVALKSAARLKSVLGECEETKDLIEQYFSNERTANDVMSTIANRIQRYQYVAAAWEKAERYISIKDWIQKEYILVLGNDEETRSAVDALNQVIFKRVTEIILNQSESFSRRTWIVLDELKEAGELPGLTSLLSKGRSKGACVIIGFQDIEGLSVAMKDTRLAHEVTGLCANKAILRLDSAETAKWASLQFGEQEIEQRKISTSSGSSTQGGSGSARDTSSTSTSESWVSMKRQAVMPAQFLDLPPVEKSGLLHGYYIIPSVGSYYAGIKMSGEGSILESIKAVSDNTPGYIERSIEDQYLRLWDDKDLERLNLVSLKKTDEQYTKTKEFSQIREDTVYTEPEFDPLELIKRT